MKKALVTGANGFIGSLLTDELIKNGVEVIALDLQGHNNNIPKAAKTVEFDIHNCAELPHKIPDRDIDIIFHLAWIGSSGNARGNYALQLDNVKCTCDIVKAAAQMNIKRFVGAGTIKQMDCIECAKKDGYSPDLIHNYGAAKISAQFMSKAVTNNEGIEHIWCLFPSVYGVGDSTTNFINVTIKKMLSNEPTEFTDGEQNCDFVYISDMIYGLYLCGEKGKNNCSYYIGSGSARKLKEYIKIIYDIIAPKNPTGIGKKQFNGVSLPLNTYDCKAIREDTGYSPKIEFKDGIKKTIAWIKSEQ